MTNSELIDISKKISSIYEIEVKESLETKKDCQTNSKIGQLNLKKVTF
ncbi:MAG: hypothetical protein WC667_10940 [Sulfurimonas sp.]|jgi:hypothetical protein